MRNWFSAVAAGEHLCAHFAHPTTERNYKSLFDQIHFSRTYEKIDANSQIFYFPFLFDYLQDIFDFLVLALVGDKKGVFGVDDNDVLDAY